MDKQTEKEAAFACALGLCRGMLMAVWQGDVDMEEIDQILESTSAKNIATVIGLPEAECVIDWNDHLAKSQIEALKGISF